MSFADCLPIHHVIANWTIFCE